MRSRIVVVIWFLSIIVMVGTCLGQTCYGIVINPIKGDTVRSVHEVFFSNWKGTEKEFDQSMLQSWQWATQNKMDFVAVRIIGRRGIHLDLTLQEFKRMLPRKYWKS